MPRRADAAAQTRAEVLTPPPALAAVAAPLAADRRWHRAILFLLLGGAILVPVVISWAGYDHFRRPKQLTMYAVAICTVAIAAMGLVLRRIRIDDTARRALRVPTALAAAGLAWGFIATLTSSNVLLSLDAMVWATSLLCIFIIASYALRGVRVELLAAAVLLPAIANATVLLLQAARIWNPWVFPEGTYFRAMKNALLGNADDVSVYLIAPALFACALTLGAPRFRVIFAIAAVYLTAAVVATEGLTALGALTAAAAVLVVCWKPRLALIMAVAAPLVLAAALLLGPPRERMEAYVESVQDGRWGSLLSGRLVPFVTAWQMFADDPLTGVGPGCFKLHYMRYRMELREQRPAFYVMASVASVNFGEVHNDHLQVLAETGAPGLALLTAGFVVIALRSRRKRGGGSPSAEVARLLAAPLAALVAIAMLAQFPMQIAASAYTYALLGAACLAWTAEDVA
ncbi:MAG: O-Antigen ligase [Acidobacteriota bacterium]|nr:O-Antigen ligase [Acidobacteriota bacterium]